MSKRAGGLTPRRAHFPQNIQTTPPGPDYLPVPRSPSLQPPSPRPSPPGSPNRMHFQDGPYRNPSRISARTVFCMLLFAVTLFGFFALLSGGGMGSIGAGKESDKLIGVDDLEVLEAGKWAVEQEDYLGECMEMEHRHGGGYWGERLSPSHQHHEDEEDLVDGVRIDTATGKRICDASISYLLTPGIGLAFHLQLIAQAWGLAKSVGKPFFIQDEGWDRGKWEDHFMPWKNADDCAPPPAEDLKACPRTAKHWVVMPATRGFHFGHDYEQLEYAKGHGVDRKRPFFDMAIEAVHELFIPSEENQRLIDLALEELRGEDGEVVPHLGVHIRRGDRHPRSWWHRNDYIPAEDFMDGIIDTWKRVIAGYAPLPIPPLPNLYIASDSPSDVLHFLSIFPKTWQTYSLFQSDHAALRRISSPSPYSQAEFNELTQYQRRELTRGAIVDMAMLGGGWGRRSDDHKPLAVVCVQSSNICRFMPFMLGWDRSFEENMYVDLDFVCHPRPSFVSFGTADIPVRCAHVERISGLGLVSQLSLTLQSLLIRVCLYSPFRHISSGSPTPCPSAESAAR
ncbi:hypothetical protein BT69DRAFT_1285181 [Atractiella rhizophila]|nr:hypothetical protein BT69DRAFT_1285181 [Atractiella rhizophila]